MLIQWLTVNENEFTVDYECEKVKEHKGKKYILVFDQFHVFKKEKEKCFYCETIMENDTIYKCRECQEIFCPSCICQHEHFRKELNTIILRVKTGLSIEEYIFFCNFSMIFPNN